MWRQLSAAVGESLAEPLSNRLFELGALSVSFQDEGDQPLYEPAPGEIPFWRNTRVTALFDHGVDVEQVLASVSTCFADGEIGDWRREVLQDRAWERAWMDHFRPMRFGERLWIVPTGFERPSDPNAICVDLDPGLAFGTGSHPTTALCLDWLDSLDMPGKTVIDFGCGSGVLGIAALLLGAHDVLAVDIDPQALTATLENARQNGVQQLIRCVFSKDMPPTQADVLLANILANPLIELADRLAAQLRPGGHLALSGVLREQAEHVRHAYEPWFELDPPVFREDWTRLTGVRRTR